MPNENAALNPLALAALINDQRQLDIDGVEVGVSRQALDELIAAYTALYASPSDAERHERAAPDGWIWEDEFTCEPDVYETWVEAGREATPFYFSAPPPPAAAQEPGAVKADEPMTWRNMSTAPKDGKHCILAVKEGAFIYSVQGAFHAGQWNAVHRDNVEPLCWMPNVRLPTNFSALSTSQSDPAPEKYRDCGVDGGQLTENQDCIGKAYTESLARGLMFEARLSLIARTIRNSLRKYGHKTAESVLPECIAADVERTLVAAATAEATEKAPDIAALRAENERLRKAITEVRAEFYTDYVGEKLTGVSYGSTALARVVGLLDAVVTPEQEEAGE